MFLLSLLACFLQKSSGYILECRPQGFFLGGGYRNAPFKKTTNARKNKREEQNGQGFIRGNPNMGWGEEEEKTLGH